MKLSKRNRKQHAEYPGAQKNVPDKRKNSVKKRKILILTASVLAALFILTAAAAAVVSHSGALFRNVYALDVNLGGLTRQQAEQMLEQANWEAKCGQAVTVALPLECAISMTAQEAGTVESAGETARRAWEYCHGRNIFRDLLTYIRCMFKKVDITERLPVDEDAVKAKAAEGVRQVQEKLQNSGAHIEEDAVELVKGSGMQLKEDDILRILRDAFEKRDYAEYTYVPAYDEDGESMDFDKLYEEIHQEVKNAVYDRDTQSASQSQEGRNFDIDEAKRLWDAAENGDVVRIPLTITEPEITTEQLNSVLFRDQLASKTTYLTASSSRNNNVTKAATAMNGVVLNPGEEFSYNNTLGQRTAASGYQAAGAYQNGKVVNEIGGGICQGSSTLYYCTLLANLEITQRYCHYFAVNYVPAGLDATVSWPSPDFKFKNNRDYPIKIEAYTNLKELTLTIKIWGTDVDGSYVRMTTEGWSTANGNGAVSYRNVYSRDGALLSSTKESESFYHFHEEDKPQPTPAPTQAPAPVQTPAPTQTPAPELPQEEAPAA